MKASIAVVAITIGIAAPARAQEATVRVHVDGDPRAVLETRYDGPWAAICNAPCDIRVPLDASYRINGDGIQQSKKFSLPSTYGVARVDVTSGDAGIHALGIVGLALGAGSMMAGLTTMIVAVFSESCSDCIGGFANTTEPNVAWALMGAGLVAMIGGGVLVGETKTQVSLTTAEPGPAARAAVLPERRAIVVPPAVGVPIVGISF
ncbi:MAG TPA: hypothetical protein VGH28_22095 [Polyangiaceae bacterium]|jgi:hypothetical protein